MVDLNWQHGDFLGFETAGRRAFWGTAYNKDARLDHGHGKYKLDDKGIHFQRIHGGGEIFLPYHVISDVSLVKSFGGKYTVGNYILRISWPQKGQTMMAGFVFAKNDAENARLLSRIKQHMSVAHP